MRLVSYELEGVAVSTADIHILGVGPQSLRGLPNGFPSQQQLPQNRSVSNRLPQAGKLGTELWPVVQIREHEADGDMDLAGNNSTWAFGGAVPVELSNSF